MNKIDVSKCENYCNGICEEYDEVYLGCEDRPECHYRQLQQIKEENKKLKKCLDEIEKICKEQNEQMEYSDIDYESFDYILQIIKEVKSNEL